MAGRKKKVVKPQTLKEFQAWLEGVEELQDNNWSPDKGQWDKIRNRITNIVEDAPKAPVVEPVPYNPMFPTQAVPQTFIPQESMMVAPDNPGMVAPQVPSSIPIPTADMTSAAAKELLGNTGKTPASESGGDSSFA